MNEINIKIYKEVGSNAAVSSEIGKEIFKIIDKALEQNNLVNLDFENISLLTSAFLNAAIGSLYYKYSSESLQNKLRLFNLSQEDRQLLKRVTDRAKEYFEERDRLDNLINDVLGNEKDKDR
jgi:hypothetical protein